MWRRRRKPDERVIACRDIAGRRHKMLVVPTDKHVTLVFPNGEVAVLEPLQAGELRGALREAVLALDDPATQAEHQQAIPTVRIHDEPAAQPLNTGRFLAGSKAIRRWRPPSTARP